LDFCEHDIRALDLGRCFEAALMMFTVLGYQLEDADLMGALATVRRHLEPSGLFVFDVWNGKAVLAERPGERQVSVTDGPVRVVRKSSAELNVSRHRCRIRFDLERASGDGRVEKWSEEHTMRYYFEEELKLVLSESQLELLSFRSFPDDEAPADERAWNAVGVARAR
jgi:hypothetical protein